MGLKEAFLNKGWAGRTISRLETVDRINPVIRAHSELNHLYDYAVKHVSTREAARELEVLQKTARADVGKLSETVLSAGGVSYNGVDLEPGDFSLAADEDKLLDGLVDKEEQFQQFLSNELTENHQIRTRAILSVVQANSQKRLEFVRSLAKKVRRPR